MTQTPMTPATAELGGRPTAPTPSVQTEMGRAAAPAAVTIGDPAPLGLAGFGLTTLILSVVNAGWFGNKAIVPLTSSTLSMAVAYGGLAQLIAGLWAFRRGNTFAGTAFCSYGAFWFSFFLLVQLYLVPMITNPASSDAWLGWVGLYLLAWGIFTGYMTIASLGASKATTVVFVLLTLTFVVLAIGWFTGDKATFAASANGIINLGGYIGILTAIAALYASFADVTNANFKRVVLPVGAPFVS
ncbi:MAG TPA: acetate uptake transporter [Candidatus Binatia bacterium]|nr:acetate uptake transporter [Candidatus Binatia bacterium]